MSDLRARLIALADDCGEPFVGARATFRELAEQAARLALDEAAKVIEEAAANTKKGKGRYIYAGEIAYAVRNLLAATLGDGSAPSS